jgi:hypothetical protein
VKNEAPVRRHFLLARLVQSTRERTNSLEQQGGAVELDARERVTTEATIENLQDLWDTKRGLLPTDDEVAHRRVRVYPAPPGTFL